MRRLQMDSGIRNHCGEQDDKCTPDDYAYLDRSAVIWRHRTAFKKLVFLPSIYNTLVPKQAKRECKKKEQEDGQTCSGNIASDNRCSVLILHDAWRSGRMPSSGYFCMTFSHHRNKQERGGNPSLLGYFFTHGISSFL